ncbi:hypothetical protein [Burkholderia sp. Bp8986]|uniref:hypothetical protein n=1 Tax=Burkholderia sp. Bp8986 TaxID=2184550 RepID=UPI00163B3686|nr:hypothetical protein [Burkholderia sp. Bp8986]
MQFVDPAHQPLTSLTRRPVMRARSRDTNKPDLLRNRQRIATTNHRFALSDPALVSAPIKIIFQAELADLGVQGSTHALARSAERPIVRDDVRQHRSVCEALRESMPARWVRYLR